MKINLFFNSGLLTSLSVLTDRSGDSSIPLESFRDSTAVMTYAILKKG